MVACFTSITIRGRRPGRNRRRRITGPTTTATVAAAVTSAAQYRLSPYRRLQLKNIDDSLIAGELCECILRAVADALYYEYDEVFFAVEGHGFTEADFQRAALFVSFAEFFRRRVHTVKDVDCSRVCSSDFKAGFFGPQE